MDARQTTDHPAAQLEFAFGATLAQSDIKTSSDSDVGAAADQEAAADRHRTRRDCTSSVDRRRNTGTAAKLPSLVLAPTPPCRIF